MKPLKDILGKPGEGIHFHVCGVAVMDVLGTVALAVLFGWISGRVTGHEDCLVLLSTIWFFCLFFMGQTMHLAIGVETTIAKFFKSVSHE